MELRSPARQVSRRALLLWRLSALAVSVVVVLVLTVALLVLIGFAWWLPVVDVVILVVWVGAIPTWRYAVHRWEVTETAVYTQTGWWARERRIAPMSRVQTVDLAEGPLERLLGLATVTVTTASAAGALRIAGLDRPEAVDLSERLTRQADAVAGDAT